MPLPHKNADNEYFVQLKNYFFNNEKLASVEHELAKQEQYKLQKEELEKEKNDLYTEMCRLQRGFSYLICFKELIDFEQTHPSALNFWNDYSQTYQTCKANAHDICERMDFIEKHPKYDIETFKKYYLPYLTDESTRFLEFEGRAEGTLKRELEEAAKNLYFKKRDERETKKALDVFTLGAEYATSFFNNDALNLKLEEAKALTGTMYSEVEELKKGIKIVKDKVRLLQRGFSYLIYYKDLIDFETDPKAKQYIDLELHPTEESTCTITAQDICTHMDKITNTPYLSREELASFSDLIREYSEYGEIKQFKVFHITDARNKRAYGLRKELEKDAIKLYKKKGGVESLEYQKKDQERISEHDTLSQGFSYLTYYKDLIDFENTNPSVLSFYDEQSHTRQTCKANAQVICEIMDSIEKNPDYDIETLIETLRQAYDCRHFKVPYKPPRGIDQVFFNTMWTTKRELEEAVLDLIIQRQNEEVISKDLIEKREREKAARERENALWWSELLESK